MTNRLTKEEKGEEVWIRIRSERALPQRTVSIQPWIIMSGPAEQASRLYRRDKPDTDSINADFCNQAFQICQSRRKELDYVLYEYIFAELHHPGFGCAGVRNVFGSAQARMNLCATANATGLTLISWLISRRGDSKVSNEIKIFFVFVRISVFVFSYSYSPCYWCFHMF